MIKYQIIAIIHDCMRFCTSCGKEIDPGKKFCEYCGTPVEQSAAAPAMPAPPPDVPAAPVSPQTVPVKSSGGSGMTLVIAGIIVVLVILAGVYVIGMPMISGSKGTNPALQQGTAFPTQAYTPIPTTRSTVTDSMTMTTTNRAIGQTYEEKYMETYNLVYSVDREFNGGQKVIFTQDLTTPPLYVKFNITPKMFFEERLVEIGLPSEHIVNVTYPSQNAWFKVLVYDADNGELKEGQGFNKDYSIMTKQEFMVRAPGNYRVEISGNDVTAEVRILTGKS